jgi:hypothetical protein
MALLFQVLNLSPTRIETGLCSFMVRFAVTRKARSLILHWQIALLTKAFRFAFHTITKSNSSAVSHVQISGNVSVLSSKTGINNCTP